MKMPENAKKTTEDENQEKNQPGEDVAINLGDVAEQDSGGHDSGQQDYQAVIDELNDKVLRAMAEAQNTRRRADIDIQNARNFGIQSFAKDLLGVMDNLFRALETIPDSEAEADPKLKNIKDGIEITKREMINVFERSGIKRNSPAGEAFDPNLHQAISQIPDGSVAPGTVLQVLQDGYTLKDRLLRPALVVVSSAAA